MRCRCTCVFEDCLALDSTRLDLTRGTPAPLHTHIAVSPRRTARPHPLLGPAIARPADHHLISPAYFWPLDRLQISTVASGALDRLQSEQDACVRYDGERKLWIYLHGNRALDSFGPPAKQA